MNIIKNIETEYAKRIQLEPEREIFLYLSLIGFCAILFFGFGARSHFQNYLANKKYLGELNEHIQNRKLKLRQSSLLIATYKENKRMIEAFDKVMPNTLSAQDYLVDFVSNTSKTGFVVENWSIVDHKQDNYALINTKLSGSLNEFPALINEIESLKRISTITSLTLTQENSIVSVNLEVMINYKPL